MTGHAEPHTFHTMPGNGGICRHLGHDGQPLASMDGTVTPRHTIIKQRYAGHSASGCGDLVAMTVGAVGGVAVEGGGGGSFGQLVGGMHVLLNSTNAGSMHAYRATHSLIHAMLLS